MPGSSREAPSWSRRAVLLAGGMGALGALAGCSVRLEDDAPDIPLLPRAETSAPVADESALVAALERVRALHRSADSTGGPRDGLPARLATVHAEQVRTLERLLTGLGVPFPSSTPTASSTPPQATPTRGTPTGGSTSSGSAASSAKSGKASSTGTPPTAAGSRKVSRRARTALAASEGRDVTAAALDRLATVSTTNADLLGSLAAQHLAASRLLGADGSRRSLTGPTGHLAGQLLRATRPAVYGFQVVAAQTPPGHRDAPSATLDALRTLSDMVERLAGGSATPAPMGYALPFRVHDEATRRKLARHVLNGLASSTAALFGAASGDAKAISGLVLVLSEAVVLGRDWGLPLRPFPGLRQP